MWILGKHVSTLTEAHLSDLVQGGVGESQTLDYKSAFALSSDEEKKSLLADVAAMANTSGGIILFGVETQRDANGRDTGVPITFPGLAGLNFDGERLKIESILRTAASPSLTTQIFVKDVALANGNTVIALGVSRSYLAPHRVAFQGTNRFYRRGQGGNYQPEVTELRRMFLEQPEWTREGLEFAQNRSNAIANVMARIADQQPVLIIHLLPFGRLDPILNVRGRKEEIGKEFLPLVSSSGYSWTYNLDGIRVYSPHGNPEVAETYCQVFRSGAVELASLGFGAPKDERDPQLIWGDSVVNTLRTRLPEAVKKMRAVLAVEPPYLVSVRLVNLRSANLHLESVRRSMGVDRTISATEVVLPPILVDDPDAFGSEQIDAALDVLWQGAGYSEVPRARKGS